MSLFKRFKILLLGLVLGGMLGALSLYGIRYFTHGMVYPPGT